MDVRRSPKRLTHPDRKPQLRAPWLTCAYFPDVMWSDLARVRDVYTHAYHRVDYDLMWKQLVTQLPSLREALGRIDPDDLEGV